MKTVFKILLAGSLMLIAFSSNAQRNKSTDIKGQFVLTISDEFHTPSIKMRPNKNAKSREAKAEVFKTNSQQLRGKVDAALKKAGLSNYELFNVVSGAHNYATIKLSKSNDLAIIKKLNWVRNVIQDRKFKAIFDRTTPFKPAGQEVDWGIPEVGAQNSSGVGKCAFVLDTGIFGKHPDLNVNRPLSTSFVPSEPAFKDQNGHGTHVAGIIAAKDNLIGVKGVAAGATIIGVKVLNVNGDGTFGQVISGTAYVAAIALPGDVANYSLSGPSGSASDAALQAEINAIANAGMFVTLSAGNNNANATGFVPARFNNTNVYTISAYDSNYNIASFSNFGNAPVDFAAPGVNILSCDLKKNGNYSTKSGTSMAAPYVAGILLVNNGVINNSGPVASDKDATLDLKARL